MAVIFEYGEGQTPLSEEEKEGLLIKTITTHGELDEHEQLNIESAVEWIMSQKPKKEKILTEKFIKNLHKKMYGKVWRWAGDFRKSQKNIGANWLYIGIELKKLLDDTHFWIDNNTFPPDEIAVRFKHKLVSIHCFPNGNGRHSRLMADIIIEFVFNEKIFTWNHSNMVKADQTRKEYIQSIKQADNGNIVPLISFTRE